MSVKVGLLGAGFIGRIHALNMKRDLLHRARPPALVSVGCWVTGLNREMARAAVGFLHRTRACPRSRREPGRKVPSLPSRLAL